MSNMQCISECVFGVCSGPAIRLHVRCINFYKFGLDGAHHSTFSYAGEQNGSMNGARRFREDAYGISGQQRSQKMPGICRANGGKIVEIAHTHDMHDSIEAALCERQNRHPHNHVA